MEEDLQRMVKKLKGNGICTAMLPAAAGRGKQRYRRSFSLFGMVFLEAGHWTGEVG
jgi:hypothetical protein